MYENSGDPGWQNLWDASPYEEWMTDTQLRALPDTGNTKAINSSSWYIFI